MAEEKQFWLLQPGTDEDERYQFIVAEEQLVKGIQGRQRLLVVFESRVKADDFLHNLFLSQGKNHDRLDGSTPKPIAFGAADLGRELDDLQNSRQQPFMIAVANECHPVTGCITGEAFTIEKFKNQFLSNA